MKLLKLLHIKPKKPIFNACDLGIINNQADTSTQLYICQKYGLAGYESHRSSKSADSNIDWSLVRQIVKENVDLANLSFNEPNMIKSVGDRVKLKDPADLKKITSYMKSSRGILLQDSIISHINSVYHGELIFAKSGRTRIMDYGSWFSVSGRVDGWDEKKRVLIEVKTRERPVDQSNRHRAQIQAYMKLFDCQQCLLVESDPIGMSNLKQSMIKYDSEELDWYLWRARQFLAYCSHHQISSSSYHNYYFI